MPQYRFTEKEVVETVGPLIQQAGGRISHNALLQALEAQGKGAMLSYVIKSAHAAGTFAGDLVLDESGAKPVLHYKLRNAPVVTPQTVTPAAGNARNSSIPPKPVQ